MSNHMEKRRSMFSLVAALSSLVALWAVACRETETMDATAEEAVDAAEAVTGEAAMLVKAIETAGDATDPDEAAAAAAAAAADEFTPTECVTATAEGATTTYVFDDCTGAYGLAHLTGTVAVTYGFAGGALTASVSSSGLHVNELVIDLNAEAAYVVSGTTERLEVTTASTATGPRGTELAIEGGYTVTYVSATECVGLSGSVEVAIGARATTLAISGFEVCGEGCPAAGGTVTLSTRRGWSLEVELDGDATASWSTNARSGEIDLSCTP